VVAVSRCRPYLAALVVIAAPALLAAVHCKASKVPVLAPQHRSGSGYSPEPHVAPETGMSCGKVAACADVCGSACPGGVRRIGCLIECKNGCRAKGCPLARKLFDALTDCIQENCLGPCMGGPSPNCRRCTLQKCAEEMRRCKEQRPGERR